MNIYYPYLEDKIFLKEFDLLPMKTQFVKITVLSWTEQPIQELQGKITNGSLSLNGDSSIRRTCNLTMVADDNENDFTNINSLISIGKKINLEIGFLNTTNKYTNFKKIWFPMGLFVIAGLSLQHNLSTFSISLTLKDKMCLLNGEFGGVIPASTRFDVVDEINSEGKTITKKLHLIEIIQYVLTEFGGEQLDNIIINDLEQYIKTIKKWVGDTTLYVIKDGESISLTTEDPTAEDDTENEETPADPEGSEDDSTNIEQIATYTYGQDIGYMYDIFYYSNELTFDAGTFVTSILDKIKTYLGNFEYFYDVYGKFIFQEIKNYKNKTYVTDILKHLNNDMYFADFRHSHSVYTFDNKIANGFSSNPQYQMIKNDYIVWGERESASTGNKIPIRYHITIDSKPTNSANLSFYCKFNQDGSLADIVLSATENYTLINPSDWRTLLLFKGFLSQKDKINYYDEQANYYFPELMAEWHKIYNIAAGEFKKSSSTSLKPIIEEDPSSINYYLDFIDNPTLVDSIGVATIGRRSKVVKQNDVNCLFEVQIPNYLFINSNADDAEDTKQWCISRDEDYIQLNETYMAQIATSSARNAAFTTIQALLNENTKYNESISFNALPIYYLEPNSRITVRDTSSQIYGDYIIKTISLPLDISGTMSISCSKAIDRE